jgi:hypothetical protein
MEPFSGNPRILSAATAVPLHEVRQEEIKEFARNLFAGKFRDLERLLPVFDNGQIETRHFCQPLGWYGREWSFPERNALYVEHALELSEKAARRALDRAGVKSEDVGALFFVSTTGISTPSLDAKLLFVFNLEAPPESYFPGLDHWACVAASADAPPAPPYTSCLCQQPTHAIAAQRIWEAASNGRARTEATAFLREIYPKLLLWYRYILTYRDPEESGLVTIYHPWESGTDNSPRWDATLETVEVGEVSPHPRYDLEHVDDPSQRLTDADYDRYLWLVQLVKRATCDEATIYRSHPFLVKDVLFSAILVAANEALLEISRLVGPPTRTRNSSRAGSPAGAAGYTTAGIPGFGPALTTTCAPPNR